MQMWPGGPAGLAHVGNDLTLANPLAFFQAGQFVGVGINGDDIVRMLNEDHVAKAILPAGELDAAIACSLDGGVHGGGVIHATMGAFGFEDRVEPIGIKP